MGKTLMVITNTPYVGDSLIDSIENIAEENKIDLEPVNLHFKGYSRQIPPDYDSYLIHTSDASYEQIKRLRGETKGSIILMGGEFVPNMDKSEAERFKAVSDAYLQTQKLIKMLHETPTAFFTKLFGENL